MLRLSYPEDLAPLGCEAPRKPGLSHLPGTGDALHRKKEGIAAINFVEGVHNKHQPRLLIILVQRKLVEEIGLYPLSRDNLRQKHSRFFIVVAVSIHGFQTIERVVCQFRSKRRRVGDAE